MGTPAYKSEPAKSRRDMRQAASDAFTLAASSYKWIPANAIDSSVSRWPSTTLNTFSTLQEIYPVPVGTELWAKIRVNSGAAGSEVRVLADDGITVVYSVTSFSSGIQELEMIIPTTAITNGVWIQARSITAGQTTSLVTLASLGR